MLGAINFMMHMDKAFEVNHMTRAESYKDKEMGKMKKLIAELMIELKKPRTIGKIKTIEFENCQTQ